MSSSTYGMGNTAIFEDLQKKIDEDTEVRDQLREILHVLDKQGRLKDRHLGPVLTIRRQASPSGPC